MEKFLSYRLPVYVIIVLFVTGFCLSITFGFVVMHKAKGDERFGALGEAATELARVPETVVRLLSLVPPARTLEAYGLEDKPTGWRFPSGQPRYDGYLLLSRFDGTSKGTVVELVSLADFKVRYRWAPDYDQEMFETEYYNWQIGSPENWNGSAFRAVHPWLLPNGDLIIKNHYSPLHRIDACSNVVWSNGDYIFSHSTEEAEPGYLWIAVDAVRGGRANIPARFYDEHIAKVDIATGKVVQTFPLVEMMLQEPIGINVFAEGSTLDDPMHLNDIEPVLQDGPYWKKGDLFLSLRNKSMIVQFRPSSGKVIWARTGPWVAQHDIDLLDDHRFSVFSNNAIKLTDNAFVDGHNGYMIHDMVSAKTSQPFRAAFEANDVRTVPEGLTTPLPGGDLYVEEGARGRSLIFSEDNQLLAEYINRADDGSLYLMNWSRYITQDLGDQVLAAVASESCNGG